MLPIYFEEYSQSVRQFALPPRTDETAESYAVNCRCAQIFSDAPHGENPVALAIFRTVGDTPVHRVPHAPGRESITAKMDRTARPRRHASNRADDRARSAPPMASKA